MAVRARKKPAAAISEQRPGFWELRLSPFLHRYALVLGAALVVVASIRIVSTYSALSPTFDEPGHFACGLEYLSKHVYRYESQHPPLARAAMALLPYIEGARLDGEPNRDQEGRKLIVSARDPGRMIFLMRLGILPFFWLACVFLYLWTERSFGRSVAVLATGLFTLMPPVLAHAGLATTDMALAAGMIATFYALLLWAASPGWQHAVLLGLATAMAVLSKFSAVGFFPVAAALALSFYLMAKWPGWRGLGALAKARAATFALAVLTGALAIWACYLFSFGSHLPAPEFFDGVSGAFAHSRHGHSAYLLGETSESGWWYFFLIALSVKTPAAVLLLIAIGMIRWWKHRRHLGYLMALAFCLGILAPAMASHVNIGVRHILPIYAGLSIVAAAGLAAVARRALLVAAGLVLWTAVSGAIPHPDYLAYFNEFAGSTPEDILVDSDLDWGQNTKMLSAYLRRAGVKSVAHNIEPINLLSELYPLPPTVPFDPYTPAPGWNVVSPTVGRHTRFSPTLSGTDYQSLVEATRERRMWFQQRQPTKRLGGLLLYYIPPNNPTQH